MTTTSSSTCTSSWRRQTAPSGGGELEASTRSDADTVESGASLPIAAFTGRLDLGVETSPPRPGGVLTSLRVSSSGLQGSILPWIDRIPQSEGGGNSEEPLVGTWPVPSCPGREQPLDIDAPLQAAPASTVRSLFAGVSAQLAAVPPPSARWVGGATTEIAVDVAGEIDQACGDGSSGGSYGFRSICRRALRW